MNGVADSAVGAILEIPPQTLQNIKDAERAINKLALTSAEAAGKVNDHWGVVAPHGLQKFIDKIAEAQRAMQSINGANINLSVNTQPLENQLNNASNAAKKTAADVSSAVQTLAWDTLDFTNINRLRDSLMGLDTNYKQLEATIKSMERTRSAQHPEDVSGLSQDITNKIQLLKEYLALRKKSEEQLKSTVTDADKNILVEQKRLLAEQLDLRKQINAQRKIVESGKITGAENLDKEEQILRRIYDQYKKNAQARQALNKADLSDAGKSQFELAFERNRNELLQAQLRFRRELNSELAKAREYTSQAQASKARISNTDEGRAQRQLNSDYKELIKIIKEYGEIRAKAASEGRSINEQEYNLIKALIDRYRIYKEDIDRVAGSFTALAEARRKAFENDRSEQLARNAVLYADAQQKAANNTGNLAAQYNKLYSEQADLMRQKNELERKGVNITAEEQAKLDAIKRRYAEISAQLDALNRKKQTAASELAQLAGAQTVSGVANRTTAKGAIDYAQQARSLRELQDAYNNLKAVMATIDPKSKQWSEMNAQLQKTKTHIDEIKKKMGEFQSQASNTSNIMGQLQGRIAAAFSIGAITGFIKKMTEVRAQFELQRVALGAIIQDRDEANKIFTQVQNMALESPFNIMQLEKATKQIAAFGFETQKLVPTMKMFADISAGLGVEIDRLVLVMGHLKARNFLEGTMVRQFTNMGFNVLGELSKYYTELEDRMVSVGEVQDRVKKKMISFEDVEEVLKRVTSAGGMFYDMQKKQSDSLWGQMQRIQDAYDLMLNEIGQSNEGVLKSGLTLVRELIKHWRDLKPYIVSAVTAMGAYMTVAVGWKMITTLVNGSKIAIALFTKGLQAAKAAQQSLNITMMSNPYAAVAAALIGLVVYIYQVVTATSKLNEEMSRIGSELTDSLNESIVTFKQLADTISDTNKTYTERSEAMTEMRRIYADILPKEKLEIDYIKSLNGNYSELNKTIQEYYQQKEYNQKVEAIQGSDEAEKVRKTLEDTLNQMNEEGAFDMKYSKAMIKSWSETIAKEINTGKIPASLDALESRIKEVFNAKDLSRFRDETYGFADMHDVMQAVEKVQKAYGDITIETANAENALASYSKQLTRLDLSQLDKAGKELQAQADSLRKQIEYYSAGAIGRGLDAKAQPEVARRIEQLEAVERQIKAVDEAERQYLSNQFKEKVEELNNELLKQVKAYKDAQNEMQKLEMQGKKNIKGTNELTKEYKEQQKKLDGAKESADKLANTYNTKVDWATINAAQTSYELKGALDTLSKQAFPKVAELAMKSMNKVIEYFLKAKGKAYEFVKGLLDFIPEEVRSAIGINTILENVDKRIALTNTQLQELEKSINEVKGSSEDAGNGLGKMVSDKTISRAKEFGANVKTLDDIIEKANGSAEEAAKELRQNAKIWEETVKSYETSTDKALWLGARPEITEESIELMKKNAEAAKALATDLAGVEKSAKTRKGAQGKDELSELWKNRLKALQDFYKRYEELRKHFNETESLARAKDAFQGLFDVLKMDMGKVVSMGMNKQGLADNIKSMLDAVRVVRPKLADEFEKAFADVQIQVDFKVAEDNEEKLKKQLDDMFASYELTKELKGLGVPVDLIFSLGGEPMDLDKLKKRLQDEFEAIGGKAASENIVKMYEDSFKKIADLENKQNQQQLKNYVKYLTEAMGERAQIQIKAIQDINKIENDAMLDNFSKQQAIMQRRRKMQEDLTKFDLDELKSSDVYISVFKDLEKASKEQLQYVINKLKEMQTAFSDLSPAQVKSIANDLKKMEDALAGKDSTKNLFSNLKASVEYAKKRNDLLREQTRLQNEVDASSKALSNAEVYLTELELQRKSIQDESSEEWQVANEKVLQQQALVKHLQEQIEELKKKLGEVTGKIDKGESAWKKWKAAISEIRNGMNQLKESFDAVYSGLDSMGLINDAFRDTYESIGDIIGGLDTFMTGLESIDITKPFSIITGGIKSIGGIFQTIGGFFGLGDKKKEREIKKLTEKVEALDKAYQKLEKSIEAAYTFSDYNAGYKQMQETLAAEKKAYEEMLALEKAKKKSDKEKVKEYEDKLDEIAEKEEELRKSMLEDMGSTTDYRGAAEDFVSAWLDAYKETGDGLDALGDKWDEFIQNMFIKQAAMAKAGDIYAKVIDIFNKAFDEGKRGEALQYAVDEAEKAAANANEYMNMYLKGLADIFHIKPGGAGELILSDLQKGIQNITEPQAAAIEAYLNSMRFAVFTHTEQLERLIATVQAQYGSGAENPVVTELKGIRGVLDSIDRRLGSVIKSSVGKTYIQVG